MSPDRAYCQWFEQYRLVLAHAVPYHLTNKEYVDRWLALGGLYDRMNPKRRTDG